MQERFRDVLGAQPVPWTEVRGDVDQRVREARAFLEPLLGRNRIGPSLEELSHHRVP
jgi:hypothetical protein